MRKRSYRPYGGRKKSVWPKVLLALLLAGVTLFCGLEAAILGGARTELAEEPELMVVFGCQVLPSGEPSVLLRDRLDTALQYLQEHKDITVVVSGGQGKNEPISEARCMYDYLTARGVDSSRILVEERSSNTWQNILYTRELVQSEIGSTEKNVLAVSSGFHLTRIRMLWAREWEETAAFSTLDAPCTHVPSRLKMYLREPLALVKSFLFDR